MFFAAAIDSAEACGYTFGMEPPFESDIRSRLSEALGGAFGIEMDKQKIHLPARAADASFCVPHGTSPAPALAADFGALYGAPLVGGVRIVNGWLLMDFTRAFFDALVDRVNETLPVPAHDGGDHAVNRMLALARHGGSGCPDFPAARRALLLAVTAHQSRAAYKRAAQAVSTLFHAIPPRDRSAAISVSGALGGALSRLLLAARGYEIQKF